MLTARIMALGCCLVAIGLLATANAQDYPARPIKIVVGFGPGGLGDITGARRRAEDVGFARQAGGDREHAGRRRNGRCGVGRAGGAGRPHAAAGSAARTPSSPSLFKSMPYDWSTDFTTVATDRRLFDFIIVVGKDSPLKNVSDLIAAAKRDPASFNFGTISVGSVQNLSALLFASMAGLHVTDGAVPDHRRDCHGADCPTRCRSASRRCPA